MSALAPVTGGIFSDMITWVRRIIKTTSAQAISNAMISDYINRFVTYDMGERLQLFELRRQYTFESVPNIFCYQAPYTSVTTPAFPNNPTPPPFLNNPVVAQSQTVIPVYQNFIPPIYADGVQMGWFQSTQQFYSVYPELVLNEMPIQGDGTTGPYTVSFGQAPILRAFIDDIGNLLPYVYITAQLPDGSLQYIVDSGFVNASGLGLLIQTDSTFQNIIGPALTGTPPSGGGSGTVDYIAGTATFSFVTGVTNGADIETQTSPFSAGFPRICLFYNNIFKLYPVPDRAYKIQVDAYVNPSAYFNSNDFLAFAYMAEYISRGAAQKILSDIGDWDQYANYERLFREQEDLVLRRSSRQRATQRTPTIYSAQTTQNPYLYTQY